MFLCIITVAIVKDAVEIIGSPIMLQTGKQFILFLVMEIDHQFCNFSSQIFHAVMIKIYAICRLIIITTFTEPGKGFITQGLFFVTRGMECILITGIQHQVFYNFIIGDAKDFFNYKGANAYVDRSIGTGSLTRIKYMKWFFINCRKDFITKNFGPGILQCFCSRTVRPVKLSVRVIC